MWWSRRKTKGDQETQPEGTRVAPRPAAPRPGGRWPVFVLVLGLLALGPVGCGFSPLYGRHDAGPAGSGSVAAELANIRIGPIPDRLGQQMRNALLARLSPRGESAGEAYSLMVQLAENTADLGFRSDTLATLGRMTLAATVTLTAGEVGLISTNINTSVYYDYLGPRYASVVMERDAEERAVAQLAEEIRAQVAMAVVAYRRNPADPRFFRVGRGGVVGPDGRPVTLVPDR